MQVVCFSDLFFFLIHPFSQESLSYNPQQSLQLTSFVFVTHSKQVSLLHARKVVVSCLVQLLARYKLTSLLVQLAPKYRLGSWFIQLVPRYRLRSLLVQLAPRYKLGSLFVQVVSGYEFRSCLLQSVLIYKLSGGKGQGSFSYPCCSYFPCVLGIRNISLCVAFTIVYTLQVLAPNFDMVSDKRYLCLTLTLAHFVDTGIVNNPEMLKCVVKAI